jgi:hypothetical protein
MWQGIVDKKNAAGEPVSDVVRRALDESPAVTALQALAANAQLVDLLTGRRWYVMQAAREEGAEWAEIGEALGVSKQAAWEFYKRKIADQEKYAADFHDADRARSAL